MTPTRIATALGATLLAATVAVFAVRARTEANAAPSPGDGIAMTVYKSPTCGCCASWVDHVRAAGFAVTIEDQAAAPLAAKKRELGVPAGLTSCHTALVGGYVIEGHVPADLIHRLLDEKPAIVGLAVPGMPMGSPGMEGPTSQPYDVVAFARDGGTSVFARR